MLHVITLQLSRFSCALPRCVLPRWAPEIATHYGEVFWTSQMNHPLPPDIVAQFKGKVIAITGYE